MKFQDVSRKGFKFGDEGDEKEKAELESQKKEFKPLLGWLKKYLDGPFSDGESLSFCKMISLLYQPLTIHRPLQSFSPTD